MEHQSASTLSSYIIMAIVAYILLTMGLFWRKKRKLHVPLMLAGITIDLAIVIMLELTRNVVLLTGNHAIFSLEAGHIIASLIAVLLYIPTVYFGIRILKNGQSDNLRPRHIKCALAAFSFRTIGFLLMFSIV